ALGRNEQIRTGPTVMNGRRQAPRLKRRSRGCHERRPATSPSRENRPRLVRCAESSSRRPSSNRAVDQMSETRQPEPEVRLAELVAALSLGVDLGFGQPMEHVLRECMIALRLADRLRLDEEERSTVYYTALLVNVGCHSDAHEQAKWFGDDIALRSGKYDHEYRSLRAAAAT